jgi:hypothetical protein
MALTSGRKVEALDQGEDPEHAATARVMGSTPIKQSGVIT